MGWYVVTFIAGLFVGMILGVLILAILSNNKIPFELYQLKEKFHFRRAISTFTTAMDSIFCADEKIQMGEEWTRNF